MQQRMSWQQACAAMAAQGIKPSKRLGQHFMVDANLLQLMVREAGVSKKDQVLEIGPGYGALTVGLLNNSKRVIAVEKDAGLAQLLREKMGNEKHLHLIQQDALEKGGHLAAGVVEMLDKDHAPLLVSNLPYNAASRILVGVFLSGIPFKVLLFTVQKEVAARMAASCGGPDYGTLSILCQSWGKVLVRKKAIPPEAFRPRPGVSSSLVKITPHKNIPESRHMQALADLVKACFSKRRKRLAKTLLQWIPLPVLEAWMARWELPENVRPEQAPWEAYLDLSKKKC